MTVSISTLFTVETASKIYATGLEIMAALGLPVTSWRADDPTRALAKFVANILSYRDLETQQFIRAGFLRTATGAWKTLVASEMYGVDRDPATYATSSLLLTNTGGGYFEREAGDCTFKSGTGEVTYHNVDDFILTSGPGTTVTIDVVCDVEGSAGNAAANAIDTIVSKLLEVEVTTSTQAVGQDEQSDDSLEDECLDSLGALSPNGPPDAYNSVVKNEERTGVSDITRAWTVADSATGHVTVYVAGASGAVAGASVTAAQTAVELWATPGCITPTVANATVDATDFEFDVSGTGIPADYEDQLSDALGALLSAQPIGGLLAASALIALAHQLLVDNDVASPSVALVLPAADTTPAAGHVVTVNSLTVNEV
jgi:hypothetical protein